LANLPFKTQHRLNNAWVNLREIDSSFHDVCLHQSRRSQNDGCDTGAQDPLLSQKDPVIRLRIREESDDLSHGSN
jgi:hypothetical protein